MSELLQHTTLQSLEVGAVPLVRHFLDRLQLRQLFEQHLPRQHGRQPAVSTADTLLVLITNLLLGRRPLYALADWVRRRVPEHLGLQPVQVNCFNDDRAGRACDHLYQADRASLLVALVKHTVKEFAIDLKEMHNDTTTVTFSGKFPDQRPAQDPNRPPLITRGYNKDHRPDLKQLVLSITVSADGAVPVHGKIYDGNTTDDQVHLDTWRFLRDLVGHSDFLYVADSKLCSETNMKFIADKNGRFLTVMPGTRNETKWFREYAQTMGVTWQELWKEPNPRNRQGPPIVYEGVESPQRSEEGYRILWIRSSLKREEDRQQREERVKRVRQWAEQKEASSKRYQTQWEARKVGEDMVEEQQANRWACVRVHTEVTEEYRQIGPGRPSKNTKYERIEKTSYYPGIEVDEEVLKAEALTDGLFPLVTNDEKMSVKEALEKYKYQPYVEKRHEQLKSVFNVMPVWLKSPTRVASLLWVYYVVELVQALIEREVRKRMEEEGIEALKLYPEGRKSEAPTAELVFAALEGHRRHCVLDAKREVLHTYYDSLSDVSREVLELLDIDTTPYTGD